MLIRLFLTQNKERRYCVYRGDMLKIYIKIAQEHKRYEHKEENRTREKRHKAQEKRQKIKNTEYRRQFRRSYVVCRMERARGSRAFLLTSTPGPRTCEK